MTDKKIDLHTHSTSSDGTLTPSELVKAAAETGICALALTDHDTVDGLEEFHDACRRYGVEGISGVEISAQHDKQMHIVGLFINRHDKEFAKKLYKLKNARETRNKRMLELVRANGMDITEEDILSQKDGASLLNAGRPHIARAMVDKGYVSDIAEAFDKYLKRGNPCYVKRITYSPEESIRMIKDAGGTAVLAHPAYITEDCDELYALLCELKEMGLDGAECFYSSYSAEFSDMCSRICDKIGLVKSGGSDFHGANKPDTPLGRVSTGYVPYRTLLNIKIHRGAGS